MNEQKAVTKIAEYCLGQKVMVWAANFNYWGTLIDCDEGALVLEDPYIVFETGDFSGGIKDKQKLKSSISVIPIPAIENVSPYDE